MCGIVGYVGSRDCLPILIEGIKRLEYRGYDSAGVAIQTPDGMRVVKSAGKIRALETRLQNGAPRGTFGIAHTRWATHGEPNDTNAHPHTDEHATVALVHNGIIENHAELRERQAANGYEFTSDTDTEVAVNLVHQYLEAGLDLLAAVQAAAPELDGASPSA